MKKNLSDNHIWYTSPFEASASSYSPCTLPPPRSEGDDEKFKHLDVRIFYTIRERTSAPEIASCSTLHCHKTSWPHQLHAAPTLYTNTWFNFANRNDGLTKVLMLPNVSACRSAVSRIPSEYMPLFRTL